MHHESKEIWNHNSQKQFLKMTFFIVQYSYGAIIKTKWHEICKMLQIYIII